MNIKKQMHWLALIVCAMLLLTGCRNSAANTAPADTAETDAQDSRQIIYATFYPIYALSEMMLQNVPDLELRQLVQPQDGCLRNYQISDWDLYQAAFGADAVITGGRGLESFSGALESLGDKGPAVVTLFQNLELDNNGIEASDEETSHLSDENPHLYMSARALPDILDSLHAYMVELDPMYSDIYDSNLEKALTEVDKLIAEYDSAMALIDHNTPVALMNETLIYPATDLELNVGCRIDRESGTNLYGNELELALHTLDENGISIVLIEKQAPDALVNALSAGGYAVVRLDTLSTGRADMGAEGYFEAMRANLMAITQALPVNKTEE